MKIAVLMGGTSAERDVSLVSGLAVVDALQQAGHDVVPIDTAFGKKVLKGDDINSIDVIAANPPSQKSLEKYSGEMALEAVKSPEMFDVDVVFIILHGGTGEDGTIQALLDLADIPYTGSGVTGSAVAMNKLLSKKIFAASGILTPDYFVIENNVNIELSEIENQISTTFGFPVIVKPNNQGSSVGLSLVEKADQLHKALETGYQYNRQLIIEKFIAGRELTVGILGDQVLPVAECIPEGGLYDYEHKYTSGKTEYIVPAKIDNDFAKRVSDLGLKAFRALDCRGFGRVDFRLSEEGLIYCLEVNTLPGMTAHSLVPKAAKVAGIGFSQLVEKICQIAIEDYNRNNDV